MSVPGSGRGTRAGRATGLVVGAHRRRYAVLLDDGATLDCVLKGRAMTPVCGDRVEAATDAAGAAIIAIAPRRSLFYRSDAFREKLIAANVTQVVGVVAPDVAADENLLNRWIVAAETERCRFVLAQNKADLPGTAAFAARFARYAALGYPVVAVCAHGDVSPLAPWIAGQHTVLIGQSGVGKSTLVNALVPDAAARIGVISDALHGGRHTTTSTTLYCVPEGDGWLVDSPGMKVFGLAHCAPEMLANAFVELRDLAPMCRFRDCRHDREPGCAVQAAVVAGTVAPQRVALLRALIGEAEMARDPAR